MNEICTIIWSITCFVALLIFGFVVYKDTTIKKLEKRIQELEEKEKNK